MALLALCVYVDNDNPEAVTDALKEIVDLNWDETQRPHAVRMAVLIGDAPPHGMTGNSFIDDFPKGKSTSLRILYEWLYVLLSLL